MNHSELLDSFFKTAETLFNGFLVKTGLTLMLAGLIDIHGQAGTAFIILVMVDLLTKWTAMGYKYLVDCQAQDTDISCCIASIPAAWGAGYINSSAMKHRFVGKIIWYLLLTVMAVQVDKMLMASGESTQTLKLVWIYLGMTEAMSILENMRDAGVKQAGDLLQLISSKASSIFDKLKK